MRGQNTDRIPALDGLRAVAISLVILSHGFIVNDTSTKTARAINYTAGALGGLGVALFFSISGYLISTLLLREIDTAGGISLTGFYIRRAFRILPAAYLYLAALRLLNVPLGRGELASAALFFSNYWPHRGWFTSHFWSLSMEEHFYLWWPPMLAFLGARRSVIAAAWLIAATAIWRPWSLAHVVLPYPALQRTDMRLDAFLCAGLLAIAAREWPGVAAVFTSSAFRKIAGAALAGATLWMVAQSAPSAGIFLQSLLLPPLLFSVVRAPGTRLFRALESAPLRWMGRISYGLYLWQQLFFAGHTVPRLADALRLFVPRCAAVLIVASISYYAMERHLQQLGRRLACRGSSPRRARAAFSSGNSAQ